MSGEELTGATYDTGALIAADRNSRRMFALHRRILERGISPTVPAGVLGQAWRGGPQHALSRLLAGCEVENLSEAIARESGTLMGASSSGDLIDATVVVGALSRDDVVFTSNRADIETLCASSRKKLRVVEV